VKMMETSSNNAEWREFEKAVAAFLQALDPTATVRHNITTPDADTGAPRQRDVWIEGRLCRVTPIRVLISCKRYNRPLNEQDIDHFIGEFVSSRANKGIIYSYSGFNGLAIEKADRHNISCMRLYQDAPPDIPEVLFVPHFYCCFPRLALSLIWKEDEEGLLNTWGDLLERSKLRGQPLTQDELSK
jgi:predicted Mrr-cat superfamily restriction endonuclease